MEWIGKIQRAFGKLSLRTQNFVSNLLYITPFSVLLILLIQSEQVNIDFAIKELDGNDFLVPVMQILHKTAKLKLMQLKNDPESAQKLRSEISGYLIKYSLNYHKYYKILKFSPDDLSSRKKDHIAIDKIAKKWGELQLMSFDKPDIYMSAHSSFISNFRDIVAHAGDTSNLILDPDLDSYYLMDVTLDTIPPLLDRIQESLTFTEKILTHKNISNEDRANLSSYVGLLLKADIDRMFNDIKTSINEDKNFHGEIKSLKPELTKVMDEIQIPLKKYIALLSELTRGETESNIKEKIWAQGLQTLDATANAWFILVPQLNLLLEARVADLRYIRNESLLIGIMSLILATLVAFLISEKNILRHTSLEKLVEARTEELRIAQRMALENAHRSGMAEMAIGVIHNIGNSITNVAINSQSLEEHWNSSLVIKKLPKLKEMLEQHKNDFVDFVSQDPQGKKVGDFIIGIIPHLQNEVHFSQERIVNINKNLASVRKIILDQHEHAKVKSFVEPMNLNEEIIAARDIVLPSLLKNGVTFSFNAKNSHLSIINNKNKLQQILINLFKNSIEAMVSNGNENKNSPEI